MTRIPEQFAVEIAAAVAAERGARAAVRAAIQQQAALLERLQREGYPLTHVGVARAFGVDPSPRSRRRLAAALRMRTRRCAKEASAHSESIRDALPVVGAAPTTEEIDMPNGKLIKKTTTVEEYEVDLDADADADEDVEDVEDESGDDEDESPRKRKHR